MQLVLTLFLCPRNRQNRVRVRNDITRMQTCLTIEHVNIENLMPCLQMQTEFLNEFGSQSCECRHLGGHVDTLQTEFDSDFMHLGVLSTYRPLFTSAGHFKILTPVDMQTMQTNELNYVTFLTFCVYMLVGYVYICNAFVYTWSGCKQDAMIRPSLIVICLLPAGYHQYQQRYHQNVDMPSGN